MKKTFITLILFLSICTLYAQSKGETMLLQAESDFKELCLNFYSHSIKQIQSDYEQALAQLLDEGNNILAGKAFCRLGELEMSNPNLSKKQFSSALELTKGSGSVVELESMMAIEMWNSITGDPISAWNKIKELEPQESSVDKLEDYISILQLMALTAGRAKDITEVHRLLEKITTIDCGNNYLAIYKQLDATTDYSDFLLQYRLYEQSMQKISDAFDKVLFLIDNEMIPLNWGRVLYSTGISFGHCDDPDSGADYLRQSIDFYKLVFGDDYIELLHARKQLANLLIGLDQYEEAYSELDSTIIQAKMLFGDTNHELMTANTYYSYGYLMALRFAEAREKALESVRIANAIHSTEIEPHLMLTLSDWFLNDYISTNKDSRKLLDLCIENAHRELISLPEKDRELYWVSNGAQILQVIVNSSIKVSNDNGLLYDAALFSKGILLNASHQLDIVINNDTTGQLKKIRDNYRSLNMEADYLSQGDKSSQDESERLRQQARNAEFELLSASKNIDRFINSSECSWKDVESVLKDDEAAVEFLRYEDFDKQIKYVVSILRHHGEPINIPLTGVDDKYILSQAKGKAYSSTDFFSRILNPILPYLEGCKTVWFSPSGALSSIALENVKASRNQYASDLFSFRRLSSTKNLVYPHDSEQWKSAALYGGIDYNLSNEEIEYYVETATMRGTESLHDWKYLNGSLEEVNKISKMLEGIKIDLVTAGEGVKERFLALSGMKTNLIHIATHGFYHEDINELVGNESINIEDEAMRTCGLVFAGANNKDTDKKGNAQGLLSAAEIAEMDLAECSLVVLSACGTGLSIINYDESYGLMRAFKKAGCGSLLLTLWDIDDNVTGFFMQEFYKAKLSCNDNISALESAKKAVRSNYHDPKYWAGFILID